MFIAFDFVCLLATPILFPPLAVFDFTNLQPNRIQEKIANHFQKTV